MDSRTIWGISSPAAAREQAQQHRSKLRTYRLGNNLRQRCCGDRLVEITGQECEVGQIGLAIIVEVAARYGVPTQPTWLQTIEGHSPALTSDKWTVNDNVFETS